MYNDIEWKAKGNKEQCEHNTQTDANYARKFPRGHWSFLERGSEEKWYGIYTHKPDGSWNRMAGEMMANVSGSGHPIFRASSAFERGEWRSKGGGKKSIHFNGSHENIELLLRTVISASQLSIYGAIADLCDEVPKDIRAAGKLAALDHLEKMENSYRPLHCRKFYQCTATAKPSARIRAKIRTLVSRPEIIQIMFWCGFEACRNRTLLQNSWNRRTTGATFMPRIHDASQWKEDSCERMDSQGYENRSSLEHKSLLSWWTIQYWSSSSISISRQYRFLGQKCEWRWPTAKEEDIASGNPIAEARPRQKPTVTLTSVSIPVLERKWIDIETQRSHDHKCHGVSKSNHPTATTWSVSPSRQRRSDPLQWHHRRVQEAEVRRRFAMVTWRLDINSGKRRRSEDKISILRKSTLFQSNSCTFEQFKDIQEITLLILHCKTMHCYQKDLPSIFSMSGTRMNWIHKIHKAKTQVHLGNHQAIRKVKVKSVTTPWITEYLEYLFLQSSSRIQHARTKSRGWSRSSGTTSTTNHSFSAWDRHRRSTSSAKNRKTWSPTWTTPRSSNFAKILPNSSVLSAMTTGTW